MIEMEDVQERFLLVGVSEHDEDDTKDSMEELKELVKTAGGAVAGSVIQNREHMQIGRAHV